MLAVESFDGSIDPLDHLEEFNWDKFYDDYTGEMQDLQKKSEATWREHEALMTVSHCCCLVNDWAPLTVVVLRHLGAGWLAYRVRERSEEVQRDMATVSSIC